MIQSKKDKGLITKKAIILDTCLLIENLHNPDLFCQFFDFLRDDLQAMLLRIGPVYVEFVNGLPRDAKIKESQSVNKNKCFERLTIGIKFIEEMTKEVDVKDNKMDVVKMLVNLHSVVVSSGNYSDWFDNKASNPSLVDYLLGAMSFHEDIVIATLNHRDFPLFLYDRLYLKTFDLKGDIFTVGFYKINEKKYVELIDFASKIIKNKGKIKKSN